MRCMNLVPAEILAARRRQALLRRNGIALALWGAALALGFGLVASWQRGERRVVADLESRLHAAQVEGAVLDSLRGVEGRLEERVAVVERLEGRRPVTGLVTLVSPLLPPHLRLESLSIEAPRGNQAGVAPGSAAYFDPTSATLRLSMRGTACSPEDVAALLRALQDSRRFRRVHLARLDRPANEAGPSLSFEMVCEL